MQSAGRPAQLLPRAPAPRPGPPIGSPAALARRPREVGLLKANVERAEWDVLMGVREEHWPRIRQVSLQVGAGGLRTGRCRRDRGAGPGVCVCVAKLQVC